MHIGVVRREPVSANYPESDLITHGVVNALHRLGYPYEICELVYPVGPHGTPQHQVRRIAFDAVDSLPEEYDALVFIENMLCTDLILALEDEFNIEVPDEDAVMITTIADAIEYLNKKLGA